MKTKNVKTQTGLGHKLIAYTVIAVLVVGGLCFCFTKLREIYLEQCEITDFDRQVEIFSGKMVHPLTIAEELGLKKGANVAHINFKEKRENLLARVPNLRSIQITRKLPNRVIVKAEERLPIARLGVRGKQGSDGRVVDAEGMVFVWHRETQMLPIIREPATSNSPKGHFVSGRTQAALTLIETCRSPDFLELGILEVDTSKTDFLIATLNNYSKLKIRWQDRNERTAKSRESLSSQLVNLRAAIRSRVAPGTVIWNATVPNRIFADTQENLQ